MPASQALRLFNIAIVAPAMLVGAFALHRRIPWLGYSLGAFGLLTAGAGAINYQRYRAITTSVVNIGPATIRPSA